MNATSSSGTKPCTHYTSAVVPAAFAMYGRAKVPAAARPTELRALRHLRLEASLAPVLQDHAPESSLVETVEQLEARPCP